MFTLKQSAHIRGPAGEPLPVVWQALADKGTQFLRGQLGLIAAGPGTGKSLVALTYALRARVPTLYISADSDAFTQLSRSISILTGCQYREAERMVLEGRSEGVTELSGVPIRFAYDAGPTLDRIEILMNAYDEVFGFYPEMVVIDNITDVRTGGDNEENPFAGLESLMSYLHEMARATGAFVLGLHHVTGAYNDGDKPIPLSGLKGQIGRVPELVITLFRKKSEFGPDTMCVSTVKQRSGAMDSSGTSFAELQFVGETMQLTDFDRRSA